MQLYLLYLRFYRIYYFLNSIWFIWFEGDGSFGLSGLLGGVSGETHSAFGSIVTLYSTFPLISDGILTRNGADQIYLYHFPHFQSVQSDKFLHPILQNSCVPNYPFLALSRKYHFPSQMHTIVLLVFLLLLHWYLAMIS